MTPTATETFAQWFDRQGLKHFKARELEWYFSKVRNGVSNKYPPRAMWPNILPAMRILDKLRAEVGKPITISSTYRDLPYNRAIGSGNGSQHPKFTAVDFTVKDMTPEQVFNKLMAYRTQGLFRGGLGKYRTFVHLDTRGTNATW
jgi:uncharacterized protein YcbK (DUF882 family)